MIVKKNLIVKSSATIIFDRFQSTQNDLSQCTQIIVRRPFFFFFKLSNVIHYMNLRLHYQLDLFYFAHMEHLLAWPK